MKIFVDGKPLSSYRVTQDENGVYYENGKKYTNGSHKNLKYANGVPQYAWDFSCMVGKKVTLDVDCLRVSHSIRDGNWTRVKAGAREIMFVHVDRHASGIIKAGKPICYIAPKSTNGGYPPHLHDSATKDMKAYHVSDIIWPIKFKSGDKIQFIQKTYVRATPGTDGKIIGGAPAGGTGTIIGSRKVDAQGFVWWKIRQTEKPMTGWSAEAGNYKSYVPSITIPEEGSQVNAQQVLLAENEKLTKEIDTLKKQIEQLTGANSNLTNELLRARQEKNDAVKAEAEIRKQLEECEKASPWRRLADMFTRRTPA